MKSNAMCQRSIYERAGLVESAAARERKPLSESPNFFVIVEAHGDRFHAEATINPNVVSSVDNNVGDRDIGNQVFKAPVALKVCDQACGQPVDRLVINHVAVGCDCRSDSSDVCDPPSG
jgi:hypothetical protein